MIILRGGTYVRRVNGDRLSARKQPSQQRALLVADKLTIGSTVFEALLYVTTELESGSPAATQMVSSDRLNAHHKRPAGEGTFCAHVPSWVAQAAAAAAAAAAGTEALALGGGSGGGGGSQVGVSNRSL
jgi:hypothetical protein